MNNRNSRYTDFALCREMWETIEVVKGLDPDPIISDADFVRDKVLLSGEGSSRIFPAKNTIYNSLRLGYREEIVTEGATQALEYDLDRHTVFIASNSGRTKEGVRLLRRQRAKGHGSIAGIVAGVGTPILAEADFGYQLTCGKEEAVAATKSVVEQALYYDILFRHRNGLPLPDLKKLSELLEQALSLPVSAEIAEILSGAELLYWAGRNNGAAEELRLKTNEITRKKSDFLEGTYAAHGIEEVMSSREALIALSPFEEEEEKFEEVLKKGVGLPIVALSRKETRFPTLILPEGGDLNPYIELAAGWNLLVETGLALNINLDKPVRARKVGNEMED